MAPSSSSPPHRTCGSREVRHSSRRQADTALQLEALKYAAFSYCVTRRVTLCRQQFAKAFKLDKSFDLSPGEKGHPLWTPSFERARKEAGKK